MDVAEGGGHFVQVGLAPPILRVGNFLALESGNTIVNISPLVIELRGYVDEKGNKPFASWLEALDATAAAKVTIALTRIEQRNLSNTKDIGAGLYECKIDFGPDYRIYFGRDGERIETLSPGLHQALSILNPQRLCPPNPL